jgi:hypothetical protein
MMEAVLEVNRELRERTNLPKGPATTSGLD